MFLEKRVEPPLPAIRLMIQALKALPIMANKSRLRFKGVPFSGSHIQPATVDRWVIILVITHPTDVVGIGLVIRPKTSQNKNLEHENAVLSPVHIFFVPAIISTFYYVIPYCMWTGAKIRSLI